MGHITWWLFLSCFSVAIGATSQGQTATRLAEVMAADPVSRLRPDTDFVAGVIVEGRCRSATFRSMVATLQNSDVIVYVTMRPLPNGLASGLQYIGATASDRVLRVVLGYPLDRTERIALLGHELQHAIEVAGAPEIRSQKSLETYYRSHGVPSVKEYTYETDAARRTESRVRQEARARDAMLAPAVACRY